MGKRKIAPTMPAVPALAAFHAGPEELPTVLQVRIDLIQPNPRQPRRPFDVKRVRDQARAIRDTGTLPPLVVSEREGGFTLICGERRWHAARLAGLATVPVVLREPDAEHAVATGLIENVRGEGLDPIDEALALQSLIEDFGLTHADVASRVGRSRSHVTNALRLLNLPLPVQELVRSRELTPGHARGVLRLKQPDAQLKMAQRIVSESLSVRGVEKATPASRQARAGGRLATRRADDLPSAAPLGPRLATAHKGSPARWKSRASAGGDVSPASRMERPGASPWTQAHAGSRGPAGSAATRFMSRELQHLAKAIESRLGRDLAIFWNGAAGELRIPFDSQDQLRTFLSSLLRS